MVDGLNAFHQEAVDGTFPMPEFSFDNVVEDCEI